MIDWMDVAGEGAMPERDARFDRPPVAPQRERRAHALAYRYWDTLRAGRQLPPISEVEPQALQGFAANSVLFALAPRSAVAEVRFVGAALAAEAGCDVDRPGEVVSTPGTLIGELACRIPLMARNCQPLDFEAQFVGQAATPTLYRGVLLPFAGEDGRIGFVYGVITWKMVATGAPDEDIRAAIGSALTLETRKVALSPWDVPLPGTETVTPRAGFAQRLAAAQTWAALADTDHAHRATSLNAALSAAYDFLLAADERTRTGPDDAEIAAVVGLVFGPGLDAAGRARHRAVLSTAWRLRLGSGGLATMLDRYPDGISGFLAAQPMEPDNWPDARYLSIGAVDVKDLLAEADRAATPAPDRRSATG